MSPNFCNICPQKRKKKTEAYVTAAMLVDEYKLRLPSLGTYLASTGFVTNAELRRERNQCERYDCFFGRTTIQRRER